MKMTRKEKIKKFFDSIKTPEGFKREEEIKEEAGEVWAGWDAVLTISDETVQVIFNADYCEEYNLRISGTTNYLYDGSWYTFDRIGISDSFNIYEKPSEYITEDFTREQGSEVLEHEILRAWQKIEHLKQTVVIPYINHHITPERKEQIIENLKAGKSEHFIPGGFGTGYTLSTRSFAHRIQKQEVNDFFGLHLFIEEFDTD